MFKYFVIVAHCISWPWSKVTAAPYYRLTVILWFIDFQAGSGQMHIYVPTHPCAQTHIPVRHILTQYTLANAHIFSAMIWFLHRHDMNPINSGWGSIENHFHEGKLLLDFDSVSSAAVIWRWLRNGRCKEALQCCSTFYFASHPSDVFSHTHTHTSLCYHFERVQCI